MLLGRCGPVPIDVGCVLIIGFHDRRVFGQKVTGDPVHVFTFPKRKFAMILEIFQRNGMSPHDNPQSIPGFDEPFEVTDPGTRRITHDQPRRQMNDLGPVFYHFFRDGFHVSPGTSPAGGKSDDFHRLVLRIYGKGSDSFSERPKTFSSSTGVVAVANNDPYFFHESLLLGLLNARRLNSTIPRDPSGVKPAIPPRVATGGRLS
jgi:hypothetical protein